MHCSIVSQYHNPFHVLQPLGLYYQTVPATTTTCATDSTYNFHRRQHASTANCLSLELCLKTFTTSFLPRLESNLLGLLPALPIHLPFNTIWDADSSLYNHVLRSVLLSTAATCQLSFQTNTGIWYGRTYAGFPYLRTVFLTTVDDMAVFSLFSSIHAKLSELHGSYAPWSQATLVTSRRLLAAAAAATVVNGFSSCTAEHAAT